MRFKKRKTHRKKAVHKRKRRNPAGAVALMGNPVRRRRHVYKPKARRRYRRNPSFMGKMNISNVLINGVVAAAGAGATMMLTNMLNKVIASKGKELSVPNKNFISLAVGLGLSFILPKLKLGKYAEAATMGAVAISLVNIASASFGMSQFFTLSGANNPELDKIIANLNVSGEDDEGLLGMREQDLLGISETMSGAELMGLQESMAGEDDLDGEDDF